MNSVFNKHASFKGGTGFSAAMTVRLDKEG